MGVVRHKLVLRLLSEEMNLVVRHLGLELPHDSRHTHDIPKRSRHRKHYFFHATSMNGTGTILTGSYIESIWFMNSTAIFCHVCSMTHLSASAAFSLRSLWLDMTCRIVFIKSFTSTWHHSEFSACG